MPRRRKVTVAEQENEAPKEVKKSSKEKKRKLEPSWMEGDALTVAQLILTIQKSDSNSAKIISELTKLYKKMGHAAFMLVFWKVVMTFMIRDETDENVPRALKFFGTFIASFGEEVAADGGSHPIIQKAFSEILSITSRQHHIRARICQLITYIMSSFSQKAEIDESIMDQVIDRMVGTFIRDMSPIVRQNAILALQRLQDPDNPDDQVTRAYIYHMETDPIAKVRQACITAIAKKLPIVPHILDRLQDNDEKVRRHTYLQMSSFPVKSYKIVDRIKFLNAGLYDRSDVVKKAVNNIMLPNWIAAYDNNFADFVKAIKLDSSDNELLKFRQLAQDALLAILKKRKFSEVVSFLNLSADGEFRHCPALDKANSLEWMILWKVAIKFHQEQVKGSKQNDDDDASDEDEKDENPEVVAVTLPELSTLCDFMEKFADEVKISPGSEAKYQKLNFNHCVIVLLEIAELCDLGDEVGRERLKLLVKKILIDHDLSEHAIKEIVHVMELIEPKVEARVAFFNEIVVQMVNPGSPCEYSRKAIIEDLIAKADIDTKVKANSLKMEMMELKEKESTFVERKEYANAQNVIEKFSSINEELIKLLQPFAEESASQSLTESLSAVTTTKKIKPEDILKNLRICFHMILMKGMKTMTHELMSTYNDFVRYHLESSDTATRIWALKTATAYSMLYESLAKDVYVILKSQMFKSNNVMIWESSIGCIVDLLLRYTIDKMENNQELNGTAASQNRSRKGGRMLYTDDVEDEEDIDILQTIDVIQMLTAILDNNVDHKVLKATTVGLCKLILHGQYCTRELVSKFLLAYFNPATDAEINQILGIFFESIIRMKKQESLHEALIPTLVTLLEAPYDSPLREVKQETVLKYVIGATLPVLCSNGLNLHNTLGLKLIELMKDNPDNKDIHKVFSRELLLLEIGDDPLLKKDMILKIEALLKVISVDARTKKNITDFRDMLEGTYNPPLKFSSTARTTTTTAVDSDGGNVDSEEEEEAEVALKINKEDVLDVSVSKVELKEFDVNVTKLQVVDEGNESQTVDTVEDEIIVPATQDVENEDSSDDENNVTVMSVAVNATKSSEEEEIPPTPEPPQQITNKRHLDVSRTFSSPRNSPLRKQLRSDESSGKTPVKSPKITQSPLVDSKTPQKVDEILPTTPRSTRSRRNTPKTPAAQVISSPTTPKSPRFSSLPESKVSTPNNEKNRQTRQQAKEEIAQNTKLTRSASKKMNSEPIVASKKDAGTTAGKSKLPVKKTVNNLTKSTGDLSKPTHPTRQTRGQAEKTAAGKNLNQRPRWK